MMFFSDFSYKYTKCLNLKSIIQVMNLNILPKVVKHFHEVKQVFKTSSLMMFPNKETRDLLQVMRGYVPINPP